MPYQPGNEPEELKKHLNMLLREIRTTFPEGLIVMDMWNHARWDKLAGYLVHKLGYPNGRSFLTAYGFEVFDGSELKEEPSVMPTEITDTAVNETSQESATSSISENTDYSEHGPQQTEAEKTDYSEYSDDTSISDNTEKNEIEKPVIVREPAKKKTSKKLFLLISILLIGIGLAGQLYINKIILTKINYDYNLGRPQAQISSKDIHEGNYVLFGAYEQDGNRVNGREPVEWLVLDVRDDEALLLSKYALDCKKYNMRVEEISWDQSSIYRWLNDTSASSSSFTKSAFSPKEEEVIANNTVGKVFLLSPNEAEAYFPVPEDRPCKPTKYAESRGAFYFTNAWLLRVPENEKANISYAVDHDGNVIKKTMISSLTTVRPAIYLNLSTLDTITSIHDHQWAEATCVEASKCTICGETKGTPGGHSWSEATCTEPSTCKYCGEVKGKALGHDWAEATCTEPSTCKNCGETKGEALGHDWREATYSKPETCSRCKKTRGSALKESTSWRPNTEMSDQLADAMYAASAVDRSLQQSFDFIDNYGKNNSNSSTSSSGWGWW